MGTEEPAGQHTTIAIPGSLTDIATALEKLARIFGLGTAAIGKWLAVLDHYKADHAAGSIAQMRLRPGGVRSVVERISNGQFDQQDVVELRQMLAASQNDIEACIERLSAYGPTVRRKFGIGASDKVDDLIGGLRGKARLRYLLWELSDEVPQTPAEKEDASRRAKSILWISMI